MSTSRTSQLIAHALQALGQAGFSGVRVPGTSAAEAMDQVLAQQKLDRQDIRKIVNELSRQHLAVMQPTHDGMLLQLTPKGLHRLQAGLIRSLTISTPAVWDGKWRMVMFDVPVRYNARRALFTKQLQRLGFSRLRDSTWVHPHPCFPQLGELVRHFQLQQFVTLAEISRLDPASTTRLLRRYPDLNRRS